MRIAKVCLPAVLAAAALAGCGSGATDTGYQPNRLGMSDAQRRALYAPKYSPEQAQAQAEHEAESRRRPGGGLSPGGY
jgi:hypothetical protein